MRDARQIYEVDCRWLGFLASRGGEAEPGGDRVGVSRVVAVEGVSFVLGARLGANGDGPIENIVLLFGE